MSFLNKNKLDVDELRDKVEIKAEECGITEDMLSKKLAKISSDLKNEGVNDEDIEEKAYYRFLGSLRRRVVKKLDTLNGIIFAKTQIKDFGEYHRVKAREYIEDNGMDAAKEAGYVNEDGKYCYVDDQYREGVIPKDTRQSSYLGFFQKGDESDFYEVFLNAGQVDEEIPLFSKVSLVVRAGRTKSDFGTKKMYLDSYDGLMGEPTNVKEFAGFLVETFEDKVVSDFEVLSRKAEQKNNDWYITEGTVVSSGVIKEENDSVPFEIMSLDVDSEEISTFWINKTILPGLGNMDDKNVFIIIRPYPKRDGTLGGDIYGLCPEDVAEE